MSGYSFRVKKTERRVKVAFSDGAQEYDGALSQGFDCADGTLRAGVSAVLLDGEGIPAGAEAVYAADGAYLVYAGGACSVRTAGRESFSLSQVAFSAPPACVRVYDDTAGEALLLSDGASSALLTASGLSAESVPAFTAAAYVFERLWLVTGEEAGARLRYSSFEDWRDFTEQTGGGGYIDLPDGKGRIVALADFENDIYVFREYGLQRLRARGDERGFEVRDVFPCARVYGGTVAVAGERIVWLGADGLHAYDGDGEPFAAGFSGLFAAEQSSPRGCAAGGRYYLQAALADGQEQALFSFSEDGAHGHLLRGAFGGLCSCGGEAYAVCDGAPCVLRGHGGAGISFRRAWERTLSAPRGEGVLARLRLDADAGLRLSVAGARGARAFTLRRSGAQTFPVGIAGDGFTVRIEGDGACGQARSLTAVWAYEEAEYDD